MYFVTKQIGCMVYVYDDSDNSIDFLTKESVIKFSKKLEIKGIEGDSVKPVDVTVNPEDCNWLPWGGNIWEDIDCFENTGKGDKFKLLAGGNIYKFTYNKEKEVIKFTNGVTVRVTDKLRKFFA